MLSSEEIQNSLIGAWRLMLGKSDGLRLLDLSADGFWNSFFAIAVAAPALIVNWVGIANEIGDPNAFAGRLGLLIRLAAVDLSSWVLPLVGLALVASRAGIGDRFVHYVVASNWAGAIVTWLWLPFAIAHLFLPLSSDILKTIWLVVLMPTAVLTWRMTNAALEKGGAVGTAVFVGIFVVTLLLQFWLQALLGIAMPADA